MKKNKISFLDYLSVLIKWRKNIIINGFLICLITAIISLIIPKWYKAYTTILPPTDDGGDLGISSLLGNLPVGALGLGMGMVSEETNIFLAIINSRTVAENVVNKFQLIERFKSENMEEAIRTLRGCIAVELNDEGTVTFSAKAKTPFFAGKDQENEARELAKNMANFYMEELDRINRQLKTERAINTRIFIEKRYQQNLDDLENAEEKFREFQQKYGVVALPEQTVATITAAAELKAQIMAKEVEVGTWKQFVSNSHSELIRAQTELDQMRVKYDEFKGHKESQTNADGKKYSPGLFIPLGDIPDLGIQYLRLYREVKLQETLLEFLLPQYEQAKIRERKDTPTVQVLDKAVAPIKRKSPKRMIMVLAAGILCLVLFMMAAYIGVNLEYVKLNDSERYQQISNLLSDLKPTRWFKS